MTAIDKTFERSFTPIGTLRFARVSPRYAAYSPRADHLDLCDFGGDSISRLLAKPKNACSDGSVTYAETQKRSIGRRALVYCG